MEKILKYPEIQNALIEMHDFSELEYFPGAITILELMSNTCQEPGLNLEDLKAILIDSYNFALELSRKNEDNDFDNGPIQEVGSNGIFDS